MDIASPGQPSRFVQAGIVSFNMHFCFNRSFVLIRSKPVSVVLIQETQSAEHFVAV